MPVLRCTCRVAVTMLTLPGLSLRKYLVFTLRWHQKAAKQTPCIDFLCCKLWQRFACKTAFFFPKRDRAVPQRVVAFIVARPEADTHLPRPGPQAAAGSSICFKGKKKPNSHIFFGLIYNQTLAAEDIS